MVGKINNKIWVKIYKYINVPFFFFGAISLFDWDYRVIYTTPNGSIILDGLTVRSIVYEKGYS